MRFPMGAPGQEADGAADPPPGEPAAPTFVCDAMLGALSHWLRAAGHDAAFEHGIDDGDLMRLAHEAGRLLLSFDGVFTRRSVRMRALDCSSTYHAVSRRHAHDDPVHDRLEV
ncbi:Mut7-C RNAse domain-containing protein [Sorangium sp. So ce134]